jgi:hypothetical protein
MLVKPESTRQDALASVFWPAGWRNAHLLRHWMGHSACNPTARPRNSSDNLPAIWLPHLYGYPTFGKARQSGSSHAIFRTPWVGDPRINIQNDKGKAKAYQVRQVLLAIDKFERMRNEP